MKRIGIVGESRWMQCVMAIALGRQIRKGGGVYFPVNSEDAAPIAAAQPLAGEDAPERGASISLLIRRTRPSDRRPNSPGEDAPERGGLYFPVNSRNATAGARFEPVDRCPWITRSLLRETAAVA
jgi:hypothetical protein